MCQTNINFFVANRYYCPGPRLQCLDDRVGKRRPSTVGEGNGTVGEGNGREGNGSAGIIH